MYNPPLQPTIHLLLLPPGYAGYKLCYHEVMKVIKGIVHQPFEVKGSSVFYAFSYYFDRAVESGLIGERGEPSHSGRHTSVCKVTAHCREKVFMCFFPPSDRWQSWRYG